MTLDDRISSIRMLLTQRDEIDAQLALLIGDELQPQPSEKRTKRAPRQPKPVTKKGAKVCKKCGKPGHMAKTCTTPTVATPTFGDKALLTEDQFDELVDDLKTDFGMGHFPAAKFQRDFDLHVLAEKINGMRDFDPQIMRINPRA